MVLLRRLIARDFKHLNVDIDFPEGILSIGGPNESGKSSIFEAILYAFFGRTNKAPRGEKDRLINYDANELFVQLFFDLQGKRYRITRKIHRKRPTLATLHEIASDGRATLIAGTVTTLDEAVSKLLDGVGLSDMLASNVVLQKDLDRLAKLDLTQRRNVINAMMGRECLSKAVDQLNKDSSPLRRSLEPERQALQHLEQLLEQYQQNTQELQRKQEELVQLDEQLKELSRTYAIVNKRYKAVKAYKIAKEQEEALRQSLTNKTELQKQNTRTLKRLANLEEKRDRLLAQQEHLSHIESDTAAFEKISRIATELQEQTHLQAAAQASVQRTQKQLAKLEPLRDKITEYQSVKEQRISAETRQRQMVSPLLYVVSIGLLAAGIGIVFFNLLIGIGLIIASIPFIIFLVKTALDYRSLEPRLTALRDREEKLRQHAAKAETLEQLEIQLQDDKAQLDVLSKRIQRLLTRIRKQMRALSSDVFDLDKLPSDVEPAKVQAAIKSIEKRLLKLRTTQENLEGELADLREQLADLEQLKQEQKSLAEEVAVLEAELAAHQLPTLPPEVSPYTPEGYAELESQEQELDRAKVGKQTDRQHVVKRIEELTAYIAEHSDVQEEYESKQKELAQQEETLEVADLTIKALREVAERSRERVRPSVVHAMGPILATITGGKYRFPKLSEDYSLKVYSAMAGEHVQADLFSGGTEDQFLLALRLSFAITLLGGRGTAPQFLFLDEPFAGSDVTRRNNIIRLLQDDLTKVFQQIIVVSHLQTVLSASEHHYRMINGRLIPSD